MPLRDDDLRPMTPEEVAWVRAQRVPGIEPEECKVPGVAEGMCAYAGPDGMDACGDVCIYRTAQRDGSDGCSCEPKGQAFHERWCALNDGRIAGSTDDA